MWELEGAVRASTTSPLPAFLPNYPFSLGGGGRGRSVGKQLDCKLAG